MLSLSCSSFPELPTLIKVSPSNILLDELAEETSWRPYGVAAVGMYYLILGSIKIINNFPLLATAETGEIYVQHQKGNVMSYMFYDEEASNLGTSHSNLPFCSDFDKTKINFQLGLELLCWVEILNLLPSVTRN